MTKAVLLDFGDTLIDERHFLQEGIGQMIDYLIDTYRLERSRIQWTGRFRQFSREAFQELKQLPPYIKEEKAKKRAIEKLATAMYEDPDSHTLQRAYDTLIRGCGQSYSLYPETYEVLQALSSEYRLGLVSNGLTEYTDYSMNHLGIASFFDSKIVSGSIDVEKPDPKIFEMALHDLGVKAEEAVMVGNLLSYDILGANRCGIRSVWIHRCEKDKQGARDIQPTYTISSLRELQRVL